MLNSHIFNFKSLVHISNLAIRKPSESSNKETQLNTSGELCLQNAFVNFQLK